MTSGIDRLLRDLGTSAVQECLSSFSWQTRLDMRPGVGRHLSEEPLQGFSSREALSIPQEGVMQPPSPLCVAICQCCSTPSDRVHYKGFAAPKGRRCCFDATSRKRRNLTRSAGKRCRPDLDSACCPRPLRLRGLSAKCNSCLVTAGQLFTAMQAREDTI